MHSGAANFRLQQRIPVTEWRSHAERRVLAGRGRDRFLAAQQLIAYSNARSQKKIGVGVRMISQNVSASRNFPHQFRAGEREFSDQKKRGANGMPAEQLQQPRSHSGVRPIVKSERYFSRGGSAPDGRAE